MAPMIGTLRDQQREQGDDHGDAGEHDGAARRRHRARDRLAHVRAAVELVAVAEDDEERVVDADAEAEHRRQRRRHHRDVDEVAEQPDQPEAGDQRDDGGEDRHAGGDERAEGDREDHDAGGQADHLAAPRVLLREPDAEHAAGLHLDARVPRRLRGGHDLGSRARG